MNTDFSKEIYVRIPETEEEARRQLIELYEDLADGCGITVRRFGLITGIFICALFVIAACTKSSSLPVLLNVIVGGMLLRRFFHHFFVWRKMKKNAKDARSGAFPDCISKVNSLIDHAARIRGRNS